VVGRAGEELPAKATSLALRLSLVPDAPSVTDYPLVSSYTATPRAPASMRGRRSAPQYCGAYLTMQAHLSIYEPIVADAMVYPVP